MEIADGVLTADVFGTPAIEKKSENSRLWQAVSRSESKNRSSRLTVVFIHPCSKIYKKYHFLNRHSILAFATSTQMLTPPKAKIHTKDYQFYVIQHLFVLHSQLSYDFEITSKAIKAPNSLSRLSVEQKGDFMNC